MHDIPHAAILNLLAAFLVSLMGLRADDVASAPAPCRLAYYPQVSYRAESCTFALEGQPGMTVTVQLPGMTAPDRVETFVKPVLEINVKLFQGGSLVLASGGRQFAFRAVTPSEDVELKVAPGWLVDAGGAPVILLPEHKLPPPLDRRWETVKVLRNTVDDNRPKIDFVTVVTGREYRFGGDDPVWRLLPAASALDVPGSYEIDSAIARRKSLTVAGALPNLPAPQLLGLAFSGSDFHRGHREEVWRMKLEWLLQALHHAAPQLPLFVVSLPLTATEREQWATLDDTQRVACQANDALFVNGYFQREVGPVTFDRFKSAVRPHLEKVIALP